MNPLRVYEVLEQSGFSKENAKKLIEELEERDTNAATKADLKELEIKLSEKIHDQTLKILGGVAVVMTIIGAIFKVMDRYIHI